MFVQFKDGFGSQIMSIPQSNYLGVFSALGIILCAGFVGLFIRSRRKGKQKSNTMVLLDDRHREELLRKISKEEN